MKQVARSPRLVDLFAGASALVWGLATGTPLIALIGGVLLVLVVVAFINGVT